MIYYYKFINIIIICIGKGLNENAFRKNVVTAARLWKDLGHSDISCKELISQLRLYEANLEPFEFPYTEIDSPQIWWGSIRRRPQHLVQLATRLFSITPSQASCERNFSTLKWLLGDRRTRMNIEKLEGMAKVRTYYMSNICSELNYFGKELTEIDIKDMINNTNVGDILELNEENEMENNNDNNDILNIDNNSLVIEDIVDLNNFENEGISNEIDDDDEAGTLDYDPEEMVNNILNGSNEVNYEIESNNGVEADETLDEME